MAEKRSRYRVCRIDDVLSPTLREALAQDPDSLIEAGDILKPGDRCTVVKVTDDHNTRPLVLKRFNRRGPLHTAVHTLMRSRASWCWRNANLLRDAGIKTPKPLAWSERRIGLLRFESYYLTEYINGATLLDYFGKQDPDEEQLHNIVQQFQFIWNAFGTMRIVFDDMKATNFLVDAEDKLWVVDLDGMRAGVPIGFYQRGRRQDLNRFLRNWDDQPQIQAAFRDAIDTASAPAS